MGLLGKDCKLYRNTATLESPTFVEVPEATGVQIPNSAAIGSIAGRGDAIKTSEVAQPEPRITGSLVHRDDNANIDAFQNAYLAGTALIVAALNGESDVAGVYGPHGSVKVAKWDRIEDDEGSVRYDFELVFNDASATGYEWLEVSSS